MKKNLVIAAVLSLVASGLQALPNKSYSNDLVEDCVVTLKNDTAKAIEVVDTYNNTAYTVAVDKSVELLPVTHHHQRPHHRALKVYVFNEDGSKKLTYSIVEKRCARNGESKELKMTDVMTYVTDPSTRFEVQYMGENGDGVSPICRRCHVCHRGSCNENVAPRVCSRCHIRHTGRCGERYHSRCHTCTKCHRCHTGPCEKRVSTCRSGRCGTRANRVVRAQVTAPAVVEEMDVE